MTNAERLRAYVRQTGRRWPTPRQRKRALKKMRRGAQQ